MWHFIKFTNTRSEETKSREVQGRSKGAKKFKGAQIHSLNRNLSSSKTNKRSSLLSPLSSYSSNSPSPSCSSTLENSLADAALLAAFSSSVSKWRLRLIHLSIMRALCVELNLMRFLTQTHSQPSHSVCRMIKKGRCVVVNRATINDPYYVPSSSECLQTSHALQTH